MDVVNGLLAKLAHDADFQEDLKKPQVQVVSPTYLHTYPHTHACKAEHQPTHTPHLHTHTHIHTHQQTQAMKHWTAERRLPAEEAEKLMQDYNVMAVLMKIKALQTACQRAGIPVPLHEVLRRQTSVDEGRLEKAGVKPLVGATAGGSGGGSGDDGAAAKKKKKEESEGEAAAGKKASTTTTTATATAAAPTRRKKPAGSFTTQTPPPPPPQRQQQVQVPTTLFGWVHLFSPLVALIFGLLYVLNLNFFKQK